MQASGRDARGIGCRGRGSNLEREGSVALHLSSEIGFLESRDQLSFVTAATAGDGGSLGLEVNFDGFYAIHGFKCGPHFGRAAHRSCHSGQLDVDRLCGLLDLVGRLIGLACCGHRAEREDQYS